MTKLTKKLTARLTINNFKRIKLMENRLYKIKLLKILQKIL